MDVKDATLLIFEEIRGRRSKISWRKKENSTQRDKDYWDWVWETDCNKKYWVKKKT